MDVEADGHAKSALSALLGRLYHPGARQRDDGRRGTDRYRASRSDVRRVRHRCRQERASAGSLIPISSSERPLVSGILPSTKKKDSSANSA
jgi:hypothetical protein